MIQYLAAGLVAGLAVVPGRVVAQTSPSETAVVSAPADPRSGPTLTARLVDAEQKARKKSATVEVKVSGIKLVDPDSVAGKPAPGQGHLHYRLDDGVVIATTAAKLSFHGLSAGTHTISVLLAGNDHAPLGPSAALVVVVP
jgi:hypothetical protein